MFYYHCWRGLADAAGLRRVGGGAKAWPGSVDVICGVD
jgi:hypothetical protein